MKRKILNNHPIFACYYTLLPTFYLVSLFYRFLLCPPVGFGKCRHTLTSLKTRTSPWSGEIESLWRFYCLAVPKLAKHSSPKPFTKDFRKFRKLLFTRVIQARGLYIPWWYIVSYAIAHASSRQELGPWNCLVIIYYVLFSFYLLLCFEEYCGLPVSAHYWVWSE